jgi:small-conductance mechanosensitive channel
MSIEINQKKMSAKVFVKLFRFYFIVILFLTSSITSGKDSHDIDPEFRNTEHNVSPVKVDGLFLFNVRGISSYPSELRAKSIVRRIEKAASNPFVSIDSVKIIDSEDKSMVYAGGEFIMNVYDIDAVQEGINRNTLAELVIQKTKKAIEKYRYDRTQPALMKSLWRSIAATGIFVVSLFILLWLIRKISNALQLKIKSSIENVENISFNLIRSSQLWKAINIFFRTLRIIATIVLIAFFIQYVLNQFPWTKETGLQLLDLFLDPVFVLWDGFIGLLPNMAFLVVIFVVTRYLLRLTKLLFNGIGQGIITIQNFETDWAIPTFRIIRVFVIVFAIIVAYPYIPGSDTSAFKGVSVFVGILFSLGSSSFISNMIAGYSMTYRGAFKKGDRIKVDNFIGYVEEQKLLITRMRSFKNEEIIIPNSVLLNSNIVNFNTRAKDLGLILHTKVGIGYETPWRQVEAMLKLAADRTPGLLKEPVPYVLIHELADFAVTYEINAFCNDVTKILINYTQLHQNILDIFNENNVQIMTPAYEGDPETPKVVPKEQWDIPLVNQAEKKNTTGTS